MTTSATEPLAAAVKGARSLGLRDAQVSVTALERACAELQRLTDELDAANSSSDRAWGREHELLQRIGQLEAERDEARTMLANALNRWHPKWRDEADRTGWYLTGQRHLPAWLQSHAADETVASVTP